MKIQITKQTIKPIELNKNNRYWFNGTTHDASGNVDVPSLTVSALLTENGLPHKDNFNPEELIGTYEVQNPENRFSIRIKKIA
jgi:hypothetical protein